MSVRTAKRLLIVGWDAADWVIVNQLFERGAMPNLRRLVETGAHADLATLEPKLSPLLWTSIATGKTADKHGILNFVEPDPAGEGLRLSASTTRRTKALWNILTQAGLRVNAVSWYASHPAEPISGVCVSNLFQDGAPASAKEPWPMPGGAVHPISFADRIASARVHPAALPAKTLLPMAPQLAKLGRGDERVKTLARHVAQCVSVHNAAMAILAEAGEWDCTMVFHEAIDTIGHHFMQYHPPRMDHVSRRDHELFRDVMHGVYRLHDIMLGEMLRRGGEDTTVILLSDHGFHSDHLRPVTANLSNEQRAAAEASWHRPFGVLAMAGPGIARGTRLPGASILDITPTAMALLGLPVGGDMDGRVLAEVLEPRVEPETIPSWDEREAEGGGGSGMHPPDMRQDPFEARNAIQQLVDLGYMAALPEDAQGRLDLTRRETQFNLGMVLLTTGHPARAVPEFESLERAKPDEPRYILCLARSLLACMRPNDAAEVLRRFLRRNGTNVDARILLAAALVAAEQRDGALSTVRQLEREQGDRPSMALALGELCAALFLWDDAERHFRRAALHDPRSAAAPVGLARVALGRERYEEAAEHCLDALELQHATPEAHHLLGVALAWMDDLEHAVQSFQIAVSMQPGHLEAHRFLAAVHGREGRGEEAAGHEAIVERLIRTQAVSEAQQRVAALEGPRGPREWASCAAERRRGEVA